MVLQEWHEERENQRTVRALLEAGKEYVEAETASWEPDDRRDACAEVSRLLEDDVTADWTHEDVTDLVDDVLSGWED
jgi:hypothetical protein